MNNELEDDLLLREGEVTLDAADGQHRLGMRQAQWNAWCVVGYFKAPLKGVPQPPHRPSAVMCARASSHHHPKRERNYAQSDGRNLKPSPLDEINLKDFGSLSPVSSENRRSQII